MSDLHFRSKGEGHFQVGGSLTFETVHGIWEQSREEITAAATPRVDLGEVTEVDSGGLALVLEWLAWAQAQGKSLTLSHIPGKLMDLARISEVAELLDGESGKSSGEDSPGDQ